MSNRLAQAQWLRGAGALLSIADFRRLLSSNLLWWQAQFMEAIVVGWLVLELTDSPWLVALAGFCRSVPLLLFGFAAGHLSDRFGRRRVILTAQSIHFSMQVTLVLLLLMDWLALWHLYATAFVLGTCWAVDWPARRALLPDLVGKQRTVDAMLLENLAQGFGRVGGPALAGVLIAGFGALGGYWFLLVISGITLWNLTYLSRRPIPRTNLRAQASPWTILGESLRYVGQSQSILGVILVTAAVNLWLVPYMTLLPVIARDVLGVGPAELGFLGAAAGIGSFFGLLLITQVRRYFSNGWILLVGTACMSVVLFIMSQSTIYWLSWLMIFFAGMGQVCFGIMQSSIILLTASDEMRSRTMGVLVLAIGADPLGKLQTGALAQILGASGALGIATFAAGLAIAAIGLLLPGLRAPMASAVAAPVTPVHSESGSSMAAGVGGESTTGSTAPAKPASIAPGTD